MSAPRLQHVLFASEDDEHRHLGAQALSAASGLTVATCAVADVLRHCDAGGTPELVVLDVGADERAALAMLGAIVQRAGKPALPVVMLAAQTGPEQRNRFCGRGALGVLTKPYGPMVLAAQLEALWQQAAARQCVTAVPAAPAQAEVSTMRVLIVEDEPLQRALLAAALRQAGIGHLEQAADGASALAALAAAKAPFDLVITDVRMDGMDGIEFLRAAQAFAARSFALSSALDAALLDSTSAVVKANGIALLGVLAKPVQPAKLRALLADCAMLGSAPVVARPVRRASAHGPAVLQQALALGQFVPFFQPKFDLATNGFDGVEVLARWLHPVHGILPPSEFIDVMEDNGMIDALTDTILVQALACAKAWDARGCRIDMAINLSTRTLGSMDLANHLRDTVAAYGIAPGRITFEMTETAVSEHPHLVLESVTRLRVLGFKVSIDDFGLGYSSLSQLGSMPFTELKIDRSFVAGMPVAGKTLAILESTLALAASLGLRTVAEGIETVSERDFLRSLGCVAGQGYWYARPMAQSEMLSWYQRQCAPALCAASAPGR